MQHKYLFLLILLLAGAGLFAQNTMEEKGQQLVYFTDGSVVKGIIIEYRLDETLVMRVGGETVHLPADKIKYITRGRQSKKYERQLEEEEQVYAYAFSERGLYNVTGLSVNLGQNAEGTTAGVGVQHVIGYQLNRWVGLGVGGGIDAYGLAEEKPFLSVFGDLRGYLTRTKVAPFYAFQMGYGFLNDKRIRAAEGGLLVYPALGVRLSGRRGANVSLDLGYKYQDSRLENGWPDSYWIWDYRYNRYVFRASLTF